MNKILFILIPVFFFLSFESCKKEKPNITTTPTTPITPITHASPVDSFIGTYTGIWYYTSETIIPGHLVSPDSSTPATINYDSSNSVRSFTFAKVSTDSFTTDTLFYLYPYPYNVQIYDIQYSSSGIYISYFPWNETDTLKVFSSADSIYYIATTISLVDGGYTATNITTKIFAGKK